MLDSPDHSEALERRIDAENYLDNIVSGITVNKTDGGLLFWDFFRYTINILSWGASCTNITPITYST